MHRIAERLLNLELLDLAALARSAELPLLRDWSQVRLRKSGPSVLEHAQAAMDALLREPPPSRDVPIRPWWSAMPAAFIAAMFLHAGAAGPSRTSHAARSAQVARDALRGLGVPFTVREHAATMIAHQRTPAGLAGGGPPPESYMRLACVLDLRALYHVLKADAGGTASQRLESFRARAEAAGVFGTPPRAPIDAAVVEELGFSGCRKHRALNALLYFRIVAGMTEPDWHLERLHQESRLPRGRLHLPIGPAGCGKSTWVDSNLSYTTIVSTDAMREELTGDPSDQSQNYLVFQRCMDRVRAALRHGKEVTFDATNYCERLRSMPVQAARWAGAEIVSYYFDVGVEEALRRNRSRRRAVPEGVILRQFRLLRLPALYEADRHIVVDERGCARPYWPVPQCPGGARGGDG